MSVARAPAAGLRITRTVPELAIGPRGGGLTATLEGCLDDRRRRFRGRGVGRAPDDPPVGIRQHPAVIEDLRQVDDPSCAFRHP